MRVSAPNGDWAEFSRCMTYRYVLKRHLPCLARWIKPALFIMLNPSTATEVKNDPTVSRCIAFAERHLCTSLTVVNLFALRATDPKELKKHEDPIGPRNDIEIEKMIFTTRAQNGIIVAAWGAYELAQDRGKFLLNEFGPFLCLGTTKDGSPRHPLYVRASKKLEEII